MKNVLIIGASGQIGSELTMELRRRFPDGNIVAGYVAGAIPSKVLQETGPFEIADVTCKENLEMIVEKYEIDTIYNLAALLSAVGETKPLLAWHIQIDGLLNVLEVARKHKCAVFCPSSIGAFGPESPKDNTPQDTIQRPRTIYGISKVTCEMLCDYYARKYDVDARSVRFPGLISNVTLPGGGTTDYAVEIYYAAVKGEKFICPLKPDTFMDMMYMPDALNACIDLMLADPSRLIHRNSFNVTAMSFNPDTIYAEIKKHYPDFVMEYQIDELRQGIADSWPNSLDDSCARAEWDWSPKFDLASMTVDMIEKLKARNL